MNSFKHLLLLAAVLFSISNAQSQYLYPPSTSEDIKFFTNNGFIDLKELNPAQVVNEKKRRELIQTWEAAQNKWVSEEQEQTRFTANCGTTLNKTRENFDPATGRFIVDKLDTFVYVNNRLSATNSFDVATNGARTANGSVQFFYTGTRTTPDSVVETFGTSIYRTRYNYVGTTDQVSSIAQTAIFSGTAVSPSRAALTYDTRGNLKTFKVERQEGTPPTWQPYDEFFYDYNAQNQVLSVKNLYYSTGGVVDSFKEVYTYDAQNRMTKCALVDNVDTVVNITAKNHNAQKRPALLEAVSNTGDNAKVAITYQANDTIIRQYILQELDPNTGSFVNAERLIYEYCGDAVAVNEVKKEELAFQVFPNPATDLLNLKLNDLQNTTVNLSVSNLAGQTVISEKNRAADAPLSISSLPSGLYVVKVQSADKIGVKTFSVIR